MHAGYSVDRPVRAGRSGVPCRERPRKYAESPPRLGGSGAHGPPPGMLWVPVCAVVPKQKPGEAPTSTAITTGTGMRELTILMLMCPLPCRVFPAPAERCHGIAGHCREGENGSGLVRAGTEYCSGPWSDPSCLDDDGPSSSSAGVGRGGLTAAGSRVGGSGRRQGLGAGLGESADPTSRCHSSLPSPVAPGAIAEISTMGVARLGCSAIRGVSTNPGKYLALRVVQSIRNHCERRLDPG